VAEFGADAIIVGGGPLGRAARALRSRVDVPVIEPIPEAVRYITAAIDAAATR
jgi:allantoin racemase